MTIFDEQIPRYSNVDSLQDHRIRRERIDSLHPIQFRVLQKQ